MSRQGWVAGSVICTLDDPGRGDWLTVRGSYYRAPVLHATRDQAAAEERWGQCIAHVTEVAQCCYRVTPGTLTARDGSQAKDLDGRPVDQTANV